MSIENPHQNLSFGEGRGSNLPAKRVEAALVDPNKENLQVERKFDELPVPVREYYRGMDLRSRRGIMTDQQILNMPASEMIDIFVGANPEYQTGRERSEDFERRFGSTKSHPNAAIDPVISQGTRAYLDRVLSIADRQLPRKTDELKRIDEVRHRLLSNGARPDTTLDK